MAFVTTSLFPGRSCVIREKPPGPDHLTGYFKGSLDEVMRLLWTQGRYRATASGTRLSIDNTFYQDDFDITFGESKKMSSILCSNDPTDLYGHEYVETGYLDFPRIVTDPDPAIGTYTINGSFFYSSGYGPVYIYNGNFYVSWSFSIGPFVATGKYLDGDPVVGQLSFMGKKFDLFGLGQGAENSSYTATLTIIEPNIPE